jgi:aspartate racemase
VKRIGLIGGTSWVSTLDYYRLLNELTNRRLGKNHSAELLLRSFDFQPLLEMVDDVEAVEEILAEAAEQLVNAGAQLLALASNTGHKFAGPLEDRDDVPLLHIGDAIRGSLLKNGAKRVGLIGTSFTMRDASLIGRLTSGGKVETVLPPPESFPQIDSVIFGELAKARFGDGANSLLKALVESLEAEGVDALLLACTELTFAFERMSYDLPIYDSTHIHCEALVNAALSEGEGC